MNTSAEQRYQTDPTFQHIVNTLYALIRDAQYTPSELREAAILASIMHEERNIRSHRYYFPDIQQVAE